MLAFVEDREIGRTLKTRNSQRAVPVHAVLRELGFLDFVNARRTAEGAQAWLFPSIAPDNRGAVEAWTKWFGRYLRSLGISSEKVFHSLRHNFIDALRAARVDQELREALFGHGWQRTTTTAGYGIRDMVLRFTASALVDAIESVCYPGLDFSHLGPTTTARMKPRRESNSRQPKARRAEARAVMGAKRPKRTKSRWVVMTRDDP
jgi:hypothetical protein